MNTISEEDKKKSMSEIMTECWHRMFDKACYDNDDLYELSIDYHEQSSGKTIRISWKDRDQRIRESAKETKEWNEIHEPK